MMRYEGKVEFDAGRAKVYSFITNPASIVTIVPDVVESKVVDGDHFTVKAKAGVGPIRGTIDFAFAIAEKEEGRRATLVGKGKGMQSTIDLTMKMEMEDAQDGCVAKWVAEAQVGGTMAGIGARLIGGIAEKYVRQVTDNLAKAASA
ncbi:MAG: SRPBCC family protein [Nitrososphaerota archaeon]|nr:SRPBCC family protein [Nitrososphaerota archaeon]MDG7030861.1 SRPBCC family protein [Nitrososphaerota archaeon]